MKITIREIAVFGMLGALMYASKIIMELAPNVHLLGVLTIAYTVVYKKKALYPIYIYVILNGLFSGFATWWVPYLYLWTVLWAVTLLIADRVPKKYRGIVFMVLNACHGFAFGVLYAPSQAILYGMNLEGMLAWIVAGFPFDFLHGVSNFFCGILIMPVIRVLRYLENSSYK